MISFFEVLNQNKRCTAFSLSSKRKISRVEHGRRLFKEELGEGRDILRKEMKTELLPLIVYSIRKK